MERSRRGRTVTISRKTYSSSGFENSQGRAPLIGRASDEIRTHRLVEARTIARHGGWQHNALLSLQLVRDRIGERELTASSSGAVRLPGADEFFPRESISNSSLDVNMTRGVQPADPLTNGRPRYGAEVIAIRRTALGEALSWPEYHLHRNASNGGCNLRHDELVQILVGVGSTEQQHWSLARRSRQIRPPDFELPQAWNSSQVDQSSASCSESG
jgi:hypothetical protein